MTDIIRPNTCRTCRWKRMNAAQANPVLECHRLPPSAHPLIAMTPQGPQVLGTISVWPVVKPEDFCGEFSGVARSVHPNGAAIVGMHESEKTLG